MYLGELVECTGVIKYSACNDLREGKALCDQLQVTIDEAKATHTKELSESQARCDELLKEKQELQRLTEDRTKEIQKMKEELKNSRAEAVQVHRDLKDAKAQHATEASSFKEEFLKSEEFIEICGPKAYHYLEVGFEGAIDLFKAHGYPPPGAPTAFRDIEDFITSLPPDPQTVLLYLCYFLIYADDVCLRAVFVTHCIALLPVLLCDYGFMTVIFDYLFLHRLVEEKSGGEKLNFPTKTSPSRGAEWRRKIKFSY
ncbi:uncharacterized protein [Primulina huaijiensis]|uniref:uncharacterized protein n=1 Tax=Primulina huaijiensis TaxID=1492673 RepID=UPI003CC6E1A8